MRVQTPELGSPRLRLRPYRPTDEGLFVALFADEEVSRYVGDGPQSVKENHHLFHRVFGVYAEQRFAVWAVVEADRAVGHDHVIGHAEVKPSPSEDVDGWELVYVLDRPYWGRGLGRELARTVTDWALGELGLQTLYATVAAANARSIAVLRHLGYTQVDERPEPDGIPTCIFRVTRD